MSFEPVQPSARESFYLPSSLTAPFSFATSSVARLRNGSLLYATVCHWFSLDSSIETVARVAGILNLGNGLRRVTIRVAAGTRLQLYVCFFSELHSRLGKPLNIRVQNRLSHRQFPPAGSSMSFGDSIRNLAEAILDHFHVVPNQSIGLVVV